MKCLYCLFIFTVSAQPSLPLVSLSLGGGESQISDDSMLRFCQRVFASPISMVLDLLFFEKCQMFCDVFLDTCCMFIKDFSSWFIFHIQIQSRFMFLCVTFYIFNIWHDTLYIVGRIKGKFITLYFFFAFFIFSIS